MRHAHGRYVSILLVALLSAASSTSLFAGTDTGFWAPYEAEPGTYLLLPFDGAATFARAEGAAGKAQAVGRPVYRADGKLAGAAELDGASGWRVDMAQPYDSGYLSLEAWVNLSAYPGETAFLIDRPGTAGRSAGWALWVDAKGALHFRTEHPATGKGHTSSTEDGAVPLNRWTHVAAVQNESRAFFINGERVATDFLQRGDGWATRKGQGAEKTAAPVYVGTDRTGRRGLTGRLDQVRVHKNAVKFWPRPDNRWTDPRAARPVIMGPPHFAAGTRPVLYLPLDGNFDTVVGDGFPDLTATGKAMTWTDGVRGRAALGAFDLTAGKLMDADEGTIEFWMQPTAFNNTADRNHRFFLVPDFFNMYTVNTTGLFKPVSLYYRIGGELIMLQDRTRTEVYPGQWTHVAVTWQGDDVRFYLDGEIAAQARAALATERNQGAARSMQFNPSGVLATFDELFVYEKRLTPPEVRSAYLRYRDPGKLTEGGLRAVELRGQYFPSRRQIILTTRANIEPNPMDRVQLQLLGPGGERLVEKDIPFETGQQVVTIPALGADGTYTLASTVKLADGKTHPGGTFSFLRKHFPWEGNSLGITGTVYPPFEPLRTDGHDVSMVQRSYTFNGFGLFDRVTALGEQILAGPATLKGRAGSGELAWTFGPRGFAESKRSKAVYKSRAFSPALEVETTSEVDVDGAVKVTLTLSPGARPERIESMWIDIPLKRSAVTLLHPVTQHRASYAGALPEADQDGLVWDSTRARNHTLLNSFVPYIWLGAERRGLAWFGENDRGWSTSKEDRAAVLQDVVERGDAVVLRVHLVQVPLTVDQPRTVVFGLMASPAKPMPENWRAKLPQAPGGLPVCPWGGLHCSYQTPYRNDWTIADKVIEARRTGKPDFAWLDAYVRQHHPPPVYGRVDWRQRMSHFLQRAASVGTGRPLAMYQEELAASVVRDDWVVYQDEWTTAAGATPRVWPDESIFLEGRNTNPSHRVVFNRSYQDFGVWVADQWMRRGVSLYWDNVYFKTSYNIHNSAAYTLEDGRVQPAYVLWNLRDYMRRIFNRMAYHRTQREEPLEWTCHMTNGNVLPWLSWCTVALDHELGRATPFEPDWLRTETTGLQAGNYPLSLYSVSGNSNPVTAKLAKDRQARVEWGMRMVHEIQRSSSREGSAPLEKVVREFGYMDRARVVNYWADAPAAAVANDRVKHIAIVRADASAALLVLSSWLPDRLTTRVTMNADALGMKLEGRKLVDVETGEPVSTAADQPVDITLNAPYGVRLLKVE